MTKLEDDYLGLGLGLGFNLIGTSPAIEPISDEVMEQMHKEPYLDESRPLTGRARNYLTRWDDGSKCDDLTNKVYIGWDLASGSDETTLVVRHPDGTLFLVNEESRTGINPDKINEWGGDSWDFTTVRVSDEYRKISDEVEQEIGE